MSCSNSQAPLHSARFVPYAHVNYKYICSVCQVLLAVRSVSTIFGTAMPEARQWASISRFFEIDKPKGCFLRPMRSSWPKSTGMSIAARGFEAEPMGPRGHQILRTAHRETANTVGGLSVAQIWGEGDCWCSPAWSPACDRRDSESHPSLGGSDQECELIAPPDATRPAYSSSPK